MNALPALDDGGGSTPDKELLAAQIRANFESLVRASPSPMVMERGAVLRTSPVRPQTLTWGLPPGPPAGRPHPAPASAQRPVPASQPGHHSVSPVQLTLLTPQPHRVGAAGGPPVSGHRLGGLRTPITARRADHGQGSEPSAPLPPPAPQQRYQHPSPTWHQQTWQQQAPADGLAMQDTQATTAGHERTPAERDATRQGAATPLSAAPQRHTPMSALKPRPQAVPSADSSHSLPAASPAAAARQRSRQAAQQAAQHSASAVQPASASRGGTWDAAEQPATPFLQLQAAASPALGEPAARSAGQQQPDVVQPLRSPGRMQHAPQRPTTSGAATPAAKMPADVEQQAAQAGPQASSQLLPPGMAALPDDSYAVLGDDDAAPVPDAEVGNDSHCAVGGAHDAEAETEPAGAVEPSTGLPAPALEPAIVAELPAEQQIPPHARSPVSVKKAAKRSVPTVGGAQPPPAGRSQKTRKHAAATADGAQLRPTSPAAAFAAQRARARAQEAEQHAAAAADQAAEAVERSPASAERPMDAASDGAGESPAKRRATMCARAYAADAVMEATAPSDSHAHVKQEDSQPVEARRSSRRRVPPLEFWRGQVVLRDPGSGDVIDIAEGAPDYVTGGAHHVKLEPGKPESAAAAGSAPSADGTATTKAGAGKTASGRAGSSKGGGSKAGGGKSSAVQSTRSSSKSERQASDSAGTAAPTGQPSDSSYHDTAGKQPGSRAAATKATRQATQQAGNGDADAAAPDSGPGATGRAGRQQRGAAVAAKGFAAAAAAANRGQLKQRCPGPAAAAKARQQQQQQQTAGASGGSNPVQHSGSKRKRPLHGAAAASAAAAAAQAAALAAVPEAAVLGEASAAYTGSGAEADAAELAAPHPVKRQRSKGQTAAAVETELATPAPRPACRDPRKAVIAESNSRQDDVGQLSSVEVLALPAWGQQALRSHDGKLILRMPAAVARARQPAQGAQRSMAPAAKAGEGAAAGMPAALPTTDAAGPSKKGAGRTSDGAAGARQQPAQQRQPQQQHRQSKRPANGPQAPQHQEPQRPALVANDSLWTDEQEAALAAAQEACDPTRSNYWRLVAKRVRGKTPQQCYDKSLERHPTPKPAKRSSKQAANGAALPLPKGRKDGKPGAAVRKYVHEVQLQEHLGNMRASRQELSPEASNGEREAELQAAEAARRQKQRYVDGFNRRNGAAGRQPAAARVPTKPSLVQPIPRDKIGVAALIDLAIAKGSGPFMDEQEEDSDEDKDSWFDDDDNRHG